MVAEHPHKKIEQSCELLFFSVRIKGLEPPRLSASDPKSDVATNYTISATCACPGADKHPVRLSARQR